MPMYEYECTACGHRFERIQKFSDPPIDECPNCGEHKVQKLVSSPAIQFKGTGWYITDYAKKSGVGTDTKTAASSEGSNAKESSSKESSKESKESRESKESKSPAPAAGSTSTAKASGE
jgi:putative FmdB family regulatory protein